MEINCAIVGDNKVGKTSFIERHVTGEFITQYIHNNKLHSRKLFLESNIGKVTFNLYEGDINILPMVQCGFVFFDVTNHESFLNIGKYISSLISRFGNIPIIICGNKVDLTNKKVSPKEISTWLHNFNKQYNITYFDISAKSNYNFDKPFLYVLRTMHFQSYIKEKPDYEQLYKYPVSFIESY